MRLFICVFLAAWGIMVPFSNRCGAVGDIGIEMERPSVEAEKIKRCPYCGKIINIGRIHGDAEPTVKNRLEGVLVDRGIGYVEGKRRMQHINVFIYRYEERQGGSYAVEKPASIGFHVHLMNKGMLRRFFICEEKQQALMDDLFNIGKFMRRGGKWVTAERLSNDCINREIGSLLEGVR
ncbi:MAG: hypothetical protein LBQ00_01030 [Syntrophobacterales bacterium]|nr:hypothetical protein [Syntrophobacterales bacterium]